MFNTIIKIGTKITILLLAVVILSVFAISYLSYTQSKNSVHRHYAQSFGMISNTKVAQIGAIFSQAERDIQFIVNNSVLSEKLAPRDSLGERIPWNAQLYQDLNHHLDSMLEPIQYLSNYSDIMLTNFEGMLLYKNDKRLKNMVVGSNYRELEKVLRKVGDEKIYYGTPFRFSLKGNQAMMNIVAPIANSTGQNIAFLIIEFNLSKKIYPLLESSDLGETGEIILGKLNGRIVKLISPLRHSDATILTQMVIIGSNMVSIQKAAQAVPPDFIQDVDYRDEPVLAYWNYIDSVGWGIVIKVDEREVNESLATLLYTFMISGSIIIFLSMLIATIFSRFLITPILSLKNRLNLVSKGVLPEDIPITSRDEIGEMGVAVQELVNSLKQTANFAHQIGEGNYDAEFNPMGDGDLLGNALLTMRDSIQEADRKDNERNWIVSGVAEIGQILRIHDTLEDLGNEVIGFVTEKIGAMQGAFHVTNFEDEEQDEENSYLEMVASYAYHKKKYLKSRFRLGEGFIGQCAIEQNTILRTEIPTDYVTITSGILGDQKPKCLLFVPLVANGQIFGVLEFAGLKTFNAVQISFVEEISVITARTIFNIRVNERTVRLLQESQQMSEELQFQQDILRQNAEEMESTQEELQRTNKRLEEQISEVNRSQKRLQVLLENASEVITIYEGNGKIRYVSPSVEAILGYSQEELVGINDIVNVHQDTLSVYKDFFENLVKYPQRRQSIQYEYRKKDGETIWLEATGISLLEDNVIGGIVLNLRNITERKRAEREERMRNQMQALSENSPDLIARLNAEGIFFYINPTIEVLTEQPPEHFINKHIKEVKLDVEIIDKWFEIFEKVRETREKISDEMEFPSKIGDRIMRVSAIPEFAEEQNLESVLIVLHDITKSKRTEMAIRQTNKKVSESINYAKRIQSAILPNHQQIEKAFPDSFVFYRPRDVVSGDFPWFIKSGDTVYFAVVDCTGHGVPGALISLIGYFLLNDIVNTRKIDETGKILDALNLGVTKTLKQDTENSKTRDGMDIALLKVNLKTQNTQYAGANRPLYHYTDGELKSIRGDRFPIGGGKYKNRTSFTTTNIKLQKGDELYMFSDGLTDQFGGPENRKFAPRRVRNLITSQPHENMRMMKDILETEFEDWKGNLKQTDDVLMVGIKF